MSQKEFAVRTLFLSNFFDPGWEMAQARRQGDDRHALVKAMKRVELADKALEKELNAFAQKGYDVASLIQHPPSEGRTQDLLITAILTRDK